MDIEIIYVNAMLGKFGQDTQNLFEGKSLCIWLAITVGYYIFKTGPGVM